MGMVSTNPPLVIGIAGGSGSGKTTVAQEILNRVGAARIAFLQHDAYYKDLSGLPPPQKVAVNFDHPNSLETNLLIQHITKLKMASKFKFRFTISPRIVVPKKASASSHVELSLWRES